MSDDNKIDAAPPAPYVQSEASARSLAPQPSQGNVSNASRMSFASSKRSLSSAPYVPKAAPHPRTNVSFSSKAIREISVRLSFPPVI